MVFPAPCLQNGQEDESLYEGLRHRNETLGFAALYAMWCLFNIAYYGLATAECLDSRGHGLSSPLTCRMLRRVHMCFPTVKIAVTMEGVLVEKAHCLRCSGLGKGLTRRGTLRISVINRAAIYAVSSETRHEAWPICMASPLIHLVVALRSQLARMSQARAQNDVDFALTLAHPPEDALSCVWASFPVTSA
jgi:hypothetical protein